MFILKINLFNITVSKLLNIFQYGYNSMHTDMLIAFTNFIQ